MVTGEKLKETYFDFGGCGADIGNRQTLKIVDFRKCINISLYWSKETGSPIASSFYRCTKKFREKLLRAFLDNCWELYFNYVFKESEKEAIINKYKENIAEIDIP